jgi:hypothetical protein
MRIQYSKLLLPDSQRLLRERFLVPEPPTEEEMRRELAGMEKLEQALRRELVNISPERLKREHDNE